MKSTPGRWPLILAALLALALSGCGEEDTQTPTKDPGAPGTPPENVASGDPDGGVADPVRTPREILAALHHALTTGEGLGGLRWQTEVQRLAEAIWPPDAEGRVPMAGRTHTALAGIAGSAAPHVLKEDADYFASNPEDRVVYDAFLQAITQGPERYQAWCEGDGVKVLETFKENRRKRIMGG